MSRTTAASVSSSSASCARESPLFAFATLPRVKLIVLPAPALSYPQQGVYLGGDPNSADSFECKY